jgi:hypothetical protein
LKTLSNKDYEVLAQRGITADHDYYGVLHISLTSNGIAWLFNYLDSSCRTGTTLSLALLKKLANFQLKGEAWRELRFKAVSIPANNDSEYFQFIFYLNGTPPTAFHSFPPIIPSITNIVSVPMIEGGIFRHRDDQSVNIKFTESEVQNLKNGNLVIAGEKPMTD